MQQQHWLKSEVVREALEMASQAMLGRFDMELHWGPNVCTDILSFIELNPDLVINLDDPDWVKWILLKAQRDHEVGHQFTDVTWRDQVTEPYTTILREQVATDIFNILEDARIELLQSLAFPGCGPSLKFSNQHWFKRTPHNSTLTSVPPYKQFLLGLCQQAIVGKMKGSLPDERADKAVLQTIPEIEEAKRARSSADVVRITHRVMEYIDDLLYEAEEEFERYSDYQPVGRSGRHSGTINPTPPPEIPHNMDPQPVSRVSPPKGAESESPSETGDGESSEETNTANAEGKTKNKTNDIDSDGVDQLSLFPFGQGEENSSTEGSDDRAAAGSVRDRGSFEASGSASAGEPTEEYKAGGSTVAGFGKKGMEDNSVDESNLSHGGSENGNFDDELNLLSPEQLEQLAEQAKREMEQLVSEHAKREQGGTLTEGQKDDEVREKAQKQLEQEVNAKHSVAIHEGIHLEVVTPQYQGRDRTFFEDMDDMKRTAARVQREVEHVLMKAQASKKPRARRKRGFLDDRMAYRAVAFNDPLVFKQRGKHRRDGGIVVGLLVDTSGSMEVDHRWFHARRAATVFSLSLRGLKVPHFVTGYRTSSLNANVLHEEYVSLHDCFSQRSLERLQWIRYNTDNRDGFSLRVAYEILARRKEQRKLLLVISDGKPNSHRYTGDAAIQDTRAAVDEAVHSGIATVGISIGKEHGHVPLIYRHHVLVSDIADLTKEVANVIERAFR